MSLSENKIRAILIMEVLGKPPEHLKEVLEGIIKSMGEGEGIKIFESKVNESVELKEEPEFYTNFAEIEVEVDELKYLASIIFNYMPAHVDIIEPEKITITNNYLGEFLSEIVRKLHGFNEIAGIAQAEKNTIKFKLDFLDTKLAGKRVENETVATADTVKEQKRILVRVDTSRKIPSP